MILSAFGFPHVARRNEKLGIYTHTRTRLIPWSFLFSIHPTRPLGCRCLCSSAVCLSTIRHTHNTLHRTQPTHFYFSFTHFTMGKSGVPSNLVAYPSLSSSLNALPQATSMSNVQLHAGIYGQRVSASEAKVRHRSFTPSGKKILIDFPICSSRKRLARPQAPTVARNLRLRNTLSQ